MHTWDAGEIAAEVFRELRIALDAVEAGDCPRAAFKNKEDRISNCRTDVDEPDGTSAVGRLMDEFDERVVEGGPATRECRICVPRVHGDPSPMHRNSGQS
jgi:hypothetical protein